MSSYDTNQVIRKITEKTESGEIIWAPYQPEHDPNPYSSKFFLSIKELRINDGYSAKYRNGHLFLIPGINNLYYLFIQALPSYLPFTFNSSSGKVFCNSELKDLYNKIESPINPIDIFLKQLLS